MYAVSAQFLDAITKPHVRQTSASHRNLINGVVTPLVVKTGSITDDATANVRRSLSMTVPPELATWNALDTVGGQITVTQTIRYADGSTETIPMGVFIVDADEIDYSPGGDLTIDTAPDLWGKVQKSVLPPDQRSSVASNPAWKEIQRLVEGAWNAQYPFPGWSQLDTTATTPAGPLVWDDGNRESAILDLCTSNSVEVFFDRNGMGVLRPVPTLTDSSTPVATVNGGAGGVIVDADRTRDRTTVSNVIIVTTTATDVTFAPVVVANTAIWDPLSTSGPLGYQAVDYSSPSLRNSSQASAAGKLQLAKTLGVAKQLSLTSMGNPALDSEDVVKVTLPPMGGTQATELHILDTITHPFAPDDTQAIKTRSTVAALS